MKIGLTYDLKDDYLNLGYPEEILAELDKPETIQAISDSLESLGHQVEKIGGLKPLMQALMNHSSWDLVFNIAEGFRGLGRESTISCLLDEYQIPYTFSDPATLSICLHKGFAKQVIKQADIPTADFTMITTHQDLSHAKLPDYPLFVKPIAEGTGKGISAQSLVRSPQELTRTCEFLMNAFSQPVLVETYLPGREFTVGMIGSGKNSRVLGIMEVQFKSHAKEPIYSYQNKAEYDNKVDYQLLKEKNLASEIETLCLNAWTALNCRDAGRIDVRLDKKGRPQFMEVNPLAGLHPVDSDLIILCRLLEISYRDLIQCIIESASRRLV